MNNKELPNPFIFENGEEITSAASWQQRRQEIINSIVDIEYGGMPPTPPSTRFECLYSSSMAPGEKRRAQTIRITTNSEPQFSFIMKLLIPPGEGPFPVVINGDGCWEYANDEVKKAVLERGYIMATFNRVEIVPDAIEAGRKIGLYTVYPEAEFGALAAWAWGYHRCVDILCQLDFVDTEKIAISGHSRGGKTVLIAGATDERIALTNPNDSGSGGAGCYRFQGNNSEKLVNTNEIFPYWFGPKIAEYVDKENELPFDQHYMKALVAPRALLTTEALGDVWANPSGTWLTYEAAKEVYKFLGAEDKIGIWYREGLHKHSLPDWQTFLDFMAWQLEGKAPKAEFNACPFDDLPKAFSWKAP